MVGSRVDVLEPLCIYSAFEEFELRLNHDFCVILIGVEGECSGNSM